MAKVGWLAPAGSSGRTRECAEVGYLALPAAIGQVYGGQADVAFEAGGEAPASVNGAAIRTSSRSPGWFRAARSCGWSVGEGMALLDEVMVAVLGDEVSPMLTGDIYCSVIEGCNEVYDLRRAHEWTAALTRWCDAQPGLVLYRGQCQVHRAEIMLRRGAWSRRTTSPPTP